MPPDGEVTDIASLQQTLREWIAANEKIVTKVGLIVGFGYDNAQLAEKRHPLREDQIDSLRTLEIIPSLFAMHTFYWGDGHREHPGGPVLADNISPTGWVLRRGMKFTSHHDAPVAFTRLMFFMAGNAGHRPKDHVHNDLHLCGAIGQIAAAIGGGEGI